MKIKSCTKKLNWYLKTENQNWFRFRMFCIFVYELYLSLNYTVSLSKFLFLSMTDRIIMTIDECKWNFAILDNCNFDYQLWIDWCQFFCIVGIFIVKWIILDENITMICTVKSLVLILRLFNFSFVLDDWWFMGTVPLSFTQWDDQLLLSVYLSLIHALKKSTFLGYGKKQFWYSIDEISISSRFFWFCKKKYFYELRSS